MQWRSLDMLCRVIRGNSCSSFTSSIAMQFSLHWRIIYNNKCAYAIPSQRRPRQRCTYRAQIYNIANTPLLPFFAFFSDP